MSNASQDDDTPQGLPGKIPEVKSMENILLETSPIDESIDLSASRELLSEEESERVPESPLEALNKEMEYPEMPGDYDTDPSQNKGLEESNSEENSLEKYFSMDAPGQDSGADIFDAIATAGNDLLIEEDFPTDKVDLFEDENDTQSEPVSLSKSVESDPIPVAFEENKGQGMKPAYSTKSLSKFFSEDDGGNDTEGKSFFESFTAAEGDEVALGTSPRPQSNFESHKSTSSSVGSPIIEASFDFQRQLSVESATHIIEAVPNTPPVSGGSDSTSPFRLGEDPFSASLNMSDVDRRHDAWLPSEMTRQALISILTAQPGTVVLQPEFQTMPGLFVDDPQGDPINELVHKFMGEQEANKRVTLTAGSVPQDETGVRQLIKAECYRAAVDLTGRLITQCGQGADHANRPGSKHTPYSLQLWFCRIALLVKLRLYSHADSEIQAFGSLDKPDLYYEYYVDKYPGRRGSMVPFEFRVLHAELPQYLGKSQDSLDRLYYLHAIVKKIMSNLESGLAEDGSMLHLSNESRKASRELWESREVRLLYSVGNCLINIKDFSNAVSVFNSLLKKDERNKAGLLCGIGRIHLQMGDINTAEDFFEKAEKCSDSTKPKEKCSASMNKGFVALGHNQFSEAYTHFQEAVKMQPTNAVAINNMAVCSLYQGKLKDALCTLESLVHQDPNSYLHEAILFNLCTLYELESSRAMHKKQTLLDLVSKHKGNGFNVACLKM